MSNTHSNLFAKIYDTGQVTAVYHDQPTILRLDISLWIPDGAGDDYENLITKIYPDTYAGADKAAQEIMRWQDIAAAVEAANTATHSEGEDNDDDEPETDSDEPRGIFLSFDSQIFLIEGFF